MDGSLIVLLGFPVLYITGSLRGAAAALKVSGKAFVLYFALTLALSLLPAVRVAQNFSLSLAGLFYCFAPVAVLIRQRWFPVGMPVAAALCVLVACMVELIWGDYTLPFLPYAEGAAIAFVTLLCIGRRSAVFAPLLAGVYESATHIVRLISGMDPTPWMSGMCAASFTIAICLFAGAIRLRAPRPVRPASRHAET